MSDVDDKIISTGDYLVCQDYCLLIYPTKKIAIAAADEADPSAAAAAASPSSVIWAAEWWSKHLGCKVRYSVAGEIFMSLETVRAPFNGRNSCLNVFSPRNNGWIVLKNWPSIEKVKTK